MMPKSAIRSRPRYVNNHQGVNNDALPNNRPAIQGDDSPVPADGQLSRSLGRDFGGHFRVAPHRHHSDMKSLTHRGYLMKRSNFPVAETETTLDAFELSPTAKPAAGAGARPTPSGGGDPHYDANSGSATTASNTSGSSDFSDDRGGDAMAPLDRPFVIDDDQGGHPVPAGGSQEQLGDEGAPSMAETPMAIRETVSLAAAFFGFEGSATATDSELHEKVDGESESEQRKESNTKECAGRDDGGGEGESCFDLELSLPATAAHDTLSSHPAGGNVAHPAKVEPGAAGAHEADGVKNRTGSNNRDSSLQESAATLPTQRVPLTAASRANQSSSGSSSGGGGSRGQYYHRCDSAPSHLGPDAAAHANGANGHPSLAPTEFVDPSDGHAWRAKFCILEDGVLYFYRNMADADSPEAQEERRSGDGDGDGDRGLQASPNSPRSSPGESVPMGGGADWLAKSPMPRPRAVMSRLAGLSPSPSVGSRSIPSCINRPSFDNDNDVVWEKRVALENVGAVRSTEEEYGECSFVLLTADEESLLGGADCLVLRAPSTEDMNEWLFQFHRSLASVMKKIVESVGSNLTAAGRGGVARAGAHGGGLYHHPGVGALQHPPESPRMFLPVDFSVEASPLHKSRSVSPSLASALSHGHGRNGIHRRRTRGTYRQHGCRASSSYSIDSGGQMSPDSMPSWANRAGGSDIGQGDNRITLDFEQSLLEDLKMVDLNVLDLSEDDRLTASTASEGRANESSTLSPRPRTGKSSLPSVGRGGGTSGIASVVRPRPDAGFALAPAVNFAGPSTGKYLPPHLRRKVSPEEGAPCGGVAAKYVPPHLRKSVSPRKDGTDNDANTPPFLPASTWSDTQAVDSTSRLEAEVFELSIDESPAVSSPPLSDPAAANNIYAAFRDGEFFPTEKQAVASDSFPKPEQPFFDSPPFDRWSSDQAEPMDGSPFVKLGGCADPAVSRGSILGPIPDERLHNVGKVRTDPFGNFGGGGRGRSCREDAATSCALQWEVGAVSECGIRDSNEDAFLIASDVSAARNTTMDEDADNDAISSIGLFAIFDGHCGSHAARFAAEKLTSFLEDSLNTADRCWEANEPSNDDVAANGAFSTETGKTGIRFLERSIMEAIARTDDEFCHLCTQDGRDWESGSTALIALVSEEHVLVANLGDCRGVICCSSTVDIVGQDKNLFREEDGWSCLVEDDRQGWVINDEDSRCFWKEMCDIHSPSREDEASRIEAANGWVTVEQEVCIGQLQRLDLYDVDVVEILQRCFSDRLDDVDGSSEECASGHDRKKRHSAAPGRLLKISRVCGELSVSRALGDRDFKKKFNGRSQIGEDQRSVKDERGENHEHWWEGPNFLPYPVNHNESFQGDLVTAIPEVQVHAIGRKGVFDEFLLLACDGLWDVMDAEDAVRVARGLLFEKRWDAKKAAARLAELAIHLGSSDNVTVILIRFFRGGR